MKLKVQFTNELPFMIQLPNGDYSVRTRLNPTEEKDFILKLSDDVFRVHINPFGSKKSAMCIEGERAELESYIINNRIPNYAFEPCKSYISCTIEEELELKDELYLNVTNDDLIDKIKSKMIREGIKYTDTIDLTRMATTEFGTYNTDQVLEEKIDYVVNRRLNELSRLVYPYHNALNQFIKQYSYLRNDFFVETTTMHTLKGTTSRQFVDGYYYDSIKHAGKAPSMMPYQKWLPEIDSNHVETLKERLINGFDIPPTKDLIIMARNLAERGEYRSAIINSSAALEVAVEQKIIEKMYLNGNTQAEIDTFLDSTKTNFYRRCDRQLNEKAGQSLVRNNPTLWTNINSHRNRYRHKIAHSSLMPNARDTEKVINDFEIAVNWVEAL
ncbi:hypothetical protein G7L40_20185 [Paenibacillus polymyxa]|uniref:Uncharacterized protein n=1 Tax=Paenibacillus polymyxa TaxID=1406 RepID=A0A378XZ07_PAEPO|nr:MULTISPECIES: hypothetical protein [Paenibacillus]KAF6620494.1 hypothetical protein HFE00_05420 [Paenibacillus sp. EKM101P]KAF6623486.1 hypothetical protein HFE03_07515 [Paenibacillus sp. EKM102P]KAF6633951.1 hypothetical protein HFE01_06990 [Paenibacillus sp. EKM10P]KAF6649478.1 hypothetical protein HFE02_01955 [Paenibacillus sp. EKM11P]MBE7896191.1 hypothetical protein [Paenibacillus polymyxa]